MKKTLSIFLIITMVLSMIPFAFAEGEQTEQAPTPPVETVPVASPTPTVVETAPVASPIPATTETTPTPTPVETEPITSPTPTAVGTAPLTVTAPSPTPTVEESFEYTQSGETVEKVVTIVEKDLTENTTVIEKTVETIENGEVTKTEHDIDIVTEESTIVQKTKDDEIVTLTDDCGCGIEGGDPKCEHEWKLKENVQKAECNRFGIDKYECDKCHGFKFVDLEMTKHTKPLKGDGTVADPLKTVDCVEQKYYVYKCTVCEEEFKVYDEKIVTGVHTYKDGICTKCDDVDHTAGVIENLETGDKPEYAFDTDTLLVSGKGEIPDYKVEIVETDGTVVDVPAIETTPWADFANKIVNIVVGSGITRIGDFAFANLNNLRTVDIYGEKTEVGDFAFADDENLEDVNFLNKNAVVTFDNPVAVVSTEVEGTEVSDIGSTAFAGDNNVSVNFSCVNPKAAEQEKTQIFAFAEVQHGDLHLNCSTIYGYKPTEKGFGLTDGLYCNDCKKVVQIQYKIYPNGKEETGKYVITDFKKLKEIPESLKITKYNSLEKISELVENFKTALAKEFKEKFKSELLKDNYKIYSIELKELKTAVKPEKHIINIPYPAGTWPEGYEYVVVQLGKDDKFEKLDTFLTNKGIQIEVETLNPVGVCWKLK